MCGRVRTLSLPPLHLDLLELLRLPIQRFELPQVVGALAPFGQAIRARQLSGDLDRALAVSNPDLSPHLSFVDMGGHGYATVRVTGEEIECEFVCIPRPVERASGTDGGPVKYRVTHAAKLWKPGQRPQLVQKVVEGDPTRWLATLTANSGR